MQTYLLSILIDKSFNLLSAMSGFGFGFLAFFIQERLRKNDVHRELTRSLLIEIQTNRIRCEAISKNAPATIYLDTACWDRIRYSDCLFSCISSRDESLYRQLIRVYNELITLNFGIARYFSATDANSRFPTDENKNAMITTLANLKIGVSLALPDIITLEDTLQSFLKREGFIRK